MYVHYLYIQSSGHMDIHKLDSSIHNQIKSRAINLQHILNIPGRHISNELAFSKRFICVDSLCVPQNPHRIPQVTLISKQLEGT